jgi:molybdopterin-containing oxidoreductase family iron-sulfur binding subunit
MLRGEVAEWETVDQFVRNQLQNLGEKRVYFLTGTVNSPTTDWMIRRFLEQNSGLWASYEVFGSSAIQVAHDRTHGLSRLPRFELEKAEVIVGIDADFLSSWFSPVEHSKGYRKGRDLEGSRLKFSVHWQFESTMSLTGCKADRRFALSPPDVERLVVALARRLAQKAGSEVSIPDPGNPVRSEDLEALVDLLWQNRGRSLVLCGCQDVQLQVLVNLINQLLENYGKTVDLFYASLQRAGGEQGVEDLLQDLNRGEVGALFIAGANPLYDFPDRQGILELLKNIPLTVSFSSQQDETARVARLICPVPSHLECWNDCAPTARTLSVAQPVIVRSGEARPLTESLSSWMGDPRTDYELVRGFWREFVFPRRIGFGEFDEFWNQTVHDGLARVRPLRETPTAFRYEALEGLASLTEEVSSESGLVSLVVAPSRTLKSEQHGHNPWLQELPDPITQVTWGSCLEVGPELAAALGVTAGDVVEIGRGEEGGLETTLTLAATIVPGTAPGTVAVGFGHGGETSRRLGGLGPDWLEAQRSARAEPVGQRVSDLISFESGAFQTVSNVRIRKTGQREDMAIAQLEGNAIVPSDWASSPHPAEEPVHKTNLTSLLSTRTELGREEPTGLWAEDHKYTGFHWGMAIDLGACTGCSACVVACQAENNIPVVGRDEVRRNRAMHWIRIDRYFDGSGTEPRADFLPVLCQQCDQAPCETVCPVLATVHSREGLNDQIYNRCIGTRYCANNCPYKVRVFNWFDYLKEMRLESLQLNPRVTVRGRGVMEKCTFCVQRIQEVKNRIVVEGRELEDGEIQPACQQTCPSRAIVFGDMNDPASAVSKLMASSRSYHLLGELGTLPSVSYLSVVRNRSEESEDG